MKFGVVYFRSLLLVSCLSFAVENLMDLTDMAIAGHLVGERGLAGVELYGVMTELLYFVGIIIANGSANYFAVATGSYNRNNMARWFSNGLIFAAIGGIFCAALSHFACGPYLAFVGVGDETLSQARAYWRWYGFQALVQPVAVYLATLVYADGDRRTCIAAFTTELVVNAVSSYLLCRAWGIAGCSVGTALGSLASMATLSIHFLKKSNSLVFNGYFSLHDSWKVLCNDFSESGCALYLVAINALMSFLAVRWFGDASLAVMAVVVMVYELLLFLDGVPNAGRVLIGVYNSEGNAPAVRDLARDGLRWSIGLSAIIGAVLVTFPHLPMIALGMSSDSEVWNDGILAVKMVGYSCVAYGIVLFYISYLLFIGRNRLSLALSVVSQNLLPVLGIVIGGWIGGVRGFWVGYTMAYPIALVLFAVCCVALIRGDMRLPYFLKGLSSSRIYNDSFVLSPQEICRIAELTGERMESADCDMRACVRAGLLIEESLMEVFERNTDRRVRAELTLDMTADPRIVLRDDGALVLSETSHEKEGVREIVLRSVMSDVSAARSLTALGINRKEFSL